MLRLMVCTHDCSTGEAKAGEFRGQQPRLYNESLSKTKNQKLEGATMSNICTVGRVR